MFSNRFGNSINSFKAFHHLFEFNSTIKNCIELIDIAYPFRICLLQKLHL